jgi:hypothetical protein
MSRGKLISGRTITGSLNGKGLKGAHQYAPACCFKYTMYVTDHLVVESFVNKINAHLSVKTRIV